MTEITNALELVMVVPVWVVCCGALALVLLAAGVFLEVVLRRR